MMKRLLFVVCSLAALGACEKTREQFDFSKTPPDEFAVIKRAPLEMPPHMTALPAPKPGMPRPQELSATQQARSSVIGSVAKTPQGATDGEVILLHKAGAASVPADIRAAVDSETAQIAKEETPTFDRLMGLTGKKVEEHAVEVDPVAETNRIKANKAAGKPVTAGETAVKEE